jgi:hypothetical protein
VEKARNHYAAPVIDLQSNSVSGGKRLKRFVRRLCQVLGPQGVCIAQPNKKAALRRLFAGLIPERRGRIQKA